MRRPWLALIYPAVVLLIAVGLAWRILVAAGEDLCLDGHCPDLGTREATQASAARIERAPALAAEVGGGIVLFGVVLGAGFSALRRRRGG